jgi:hypothetical protein
MDALSGLASPPPATAQTGFLSELQEYQTAIQELETPPEQQQFQQPPLQKRTLDVFVNVGLLFAVGKLY